MINQNLYESILSVTKKTLEILSNTQDLSISLESKYTWIKSSDDVFQKQNIIKPYWPISLNEIEKKVLNTNEYKDCLELLKTEDTIKNQVNKIVGTYSSSYILQASMIIFSPVYGLLNKTNYLSFDKDNIFDETTFNSEYSKIESFLYATHFIFEKITPLCGFHSDTLEIQLDNSIFIKKLTEDEIIMFLNFGVDLSGNFHFGGFCNIISSFAIKITYKLPKVIGEDIKHKRKKHKQLMPKEIENKILHCLRIFKTGKVYPLTTITTCKNSIHDEFMFNYGLQHKPFMSKKYILLNNEINQFKEFYDFRNKISLPENHFLSVSIRRFSQANERDCIEDKIIDLLICAEALFLSSGGSFQGELKYRLSHRAAMFIENDGERQKAMFNFMRSAYDARSSIVHGNTPKLPKKENNSEYNLEDFCKEIEEYLRVSIKKALNLAKTSDDLKNFIDWDSVVFYNKE